jgi:hypothetical protein
MKLSYPRYEVIFALQDERDEALPVVNMLMEKYPEVSARIIIGTFSATPRRVKLISRRHPCGRQSQDQ